MARNTPSDLNNVPVPKALLTMRFIWFALLMGQFTFMAVVVLQIPNRKPIDPPQPMLKWIQVAMFAVIVPAAFLIRRAIFSRATVADGVLPSAYFTGNLVFWAGCESVSFFGMIVALLNASLVPTLYVSGLAFALQVLTFPTSGNISGGAKQP